MRHVQSNKRRRLDTVADEPTAPDDELERRPTCARTDAVQINRDVQMKYDVAKNDEGPLGRTMQGKSTAGEPRDAPGQGRGGFIFRENSAQAGTITMRQHPGLEERFHNIEEHLAIKYGTF